MSVLDACGPASVSTTQLLTASVSPSTRKHPILKRLERLMDSAGEDTDADSESLELALLDVELTKYAAHEGIHIPAASPSTSAGGSSIAQQLSTTVMSPSRHQHTKPKPMQPGSVLQLVQQQSKFLDVLQSMIDKNVGADKPQQHHKVSSSTAVQAAASSDAAASATTAGTETAVASAGGAEADPQIGMLQVQYDRQVADNHALKRRCLKVQKAMLKHMQAARAQAAAAEAACEEARRREQQAAAANAALQSQLTQQQHMLDAQQQQLSGMQEQLMQLKDMHKKKLTRYKAQLLQQYESQLAAATTAYTQELSMVHAIQLSGELFNSSGGGASACSDGHPTPRQVTKKPRPSSNSGAAPHSVLASAPAAAGAGSTAAAPAAAAAAAAAATASSATKKPAPGQGLRTSAGGKSSGGGIGSKPSAAAAAAAAEPPAGSAAGGRAGPAAAGAPAKAGGSASSSRRQSHTDEAATAAAAAAAAGSQVDVEGLVRAGARLHRPSLPLEAELSGQLLQQLSLCGSLPDPHFGNSGAQLTGQAAAAAAAAAAAVAAAKQKKQQGSAGGAHRPEKPRRATVNGSGPRAQSAGLESRAARSKTPPALGMDGAAAAPAAAAAGSPPAAAAAPVAERSGSSVHHAEAAPAMDGSVAVAVAQQLQSHLLLLLAQQLAEHLPPEFADIDPNTIVSLQQAVAGHVDQQQQQQQQQDDGVGYEECQEEQGDGVFDGSGGQEGGQQHQGQQQMRDHGGSGEADVPDEVLHYAQQYQHGGEGSCRPPTATPSALQHQRQQQVPQAAAQLAQRFGAGGEGTSRPMSAPSSDRTRAMQHHHQQGQQQGQRPSSPSGRGSRQAGMRNEHPAVPAAVALEH